MEDQYVWIERMDVAHDRDAFFNDVYARRVLPELLQVPGVKRGMRYQNSVPTDPRYLNIFDIGTPDVVDGSHWTMALGRAGWREDVLPIAMNRHRALYCWVGGNRELTYSAQYLFCVMLDVEAQAERLLNVLYDEEHIPLLLKVSGVINAVRYKTEAVGHPSYLAIYEMERPDVQKSDAWTVASDSGRWKLEVRPYTYNKRFVAYERVR
jgi:hypothetical protein